MPRPAPSKSETGAADAEALEDGRRLFAQACEFVTGAAAVDHIPETGLPEVAFAGRSNVGKSTLLNALTGRATLARTSNAPGRTREINFFKLGGRLILADLPGYGYAHAPRVRVKRWTWLIDAYLRGRAGLRRACLLIDARHGIKSADRDMMAVLDGAAVSYQVVLTKCDKVKPPALETRLQEVKHELARHTAAHPEILATSARDGRGIPELRAALATLAARAKLS
ncbi:MAG TPA: ribosome biogenesis GTP-binding protein YihA/YsxC [Rhodospirillales bacterium]